MTKSFTLVKLIQLNNQFMFLFTHSFSQNCESCHSDTENDLNDAPMDCENDSSNHGLESAPKNLEDTVESAKNSPIPFRNMSRGRRRNTNKTGKLRFGFSRLGMTLMKKIAKVMNLVSFQ